MKLLKEVNFQYSQEISAAEVSSEENEQRQTNNTALTKENDNVDIDNDITYQEKKRPKITVEKTGVNKDRKTEVMSNNVYEELEKGLSKEQKLTGETKDIKNYDDVEIYSQ